MIFPITRNGVYSPFARLRTLQNEMNRMFEGTGLKREAFPAVNIWSNENEVILKAELPGVTADDMDITVEGDVLTLEGERKAENPGEESSYHRRERGSGTFIRSFRLPYEIDNGKVKAAYKDGILKITMPRAETSKPKKIKVSAE